MANTNLSGLFTDIADAIRNKDGTTDTIVASAFPERISAISTGGGAVIYKIYEYRKTEITSNQTTTRANSGDVKTIKVAEYLPNGVDVSTLTADNFMIVPNYKTCSYYVYSCSTKASSTSIYYGGAIKTTNFYKNYSEGGILTFGAAVAFGYSYKSGSSGTVNCLQNSLYYLDCDVYFIPNNIAIEDLTQS